ncbi:hypothetical protein PN836_014925 [Ningiella sp. W23]|uniref:hypothetical protein n=1 Tax=Ningiella sp. W23 TaxID=3023715 RepID=UPI003756CD72
MLEKLKNYIGGPLISEGGHALFPEGKPVNLFSAFVSKFVITWMLWGFLSMVVAHTFFIVTDNHYFVDGIKQAVSPAFWNSVATLGLVFILLGFLFCSFQILERMGKYLLERGNTLIKFSLEVAAFSYGIIVAMVIFALPEPNYYAAKTYVIGGLGLFLLASVLFILLATWWVSYCLENAEKPTYFLYVAEQKPLKIVLCLIVLAVLLACAILTDPS